jgi:hypothetical protein
MFHEPTRALFSIYPAPGTDPAAMNIYQVRARLVHVCDGFPVPSNIAALGACAINAFACMTEQVEFVETLERKPLRPLLPAQRRDTPDDDIPF